MQCRRCKRKIGFTVHTNTTVRVDGYRLHTGKTKLVETKGDCDHLPSHYLQLSDPLDVYLCVDCLTEVRIREVWLQNFPSFDQLQTLQD